MAKVYDQTYRQILPEVFYKMLKLTTKYLTNFPFINQLNWNRLNINFFILKLKYEMKHKLAHSVVF